MAALARVYGDSILMSKRWVVATLAGYQESYRTAHEPGLRLELRREMPSRPCDNAWPSGEQGLNKAMSARERTLSNRCRHVIGVSLALALVAHPAMAESHATASAAGHAHAEDVSPLLPTANPGPSGDLFPATAQTLDQAYDQYTAFKNTMQTTTNVQIAMPVSIFWQAGTPNGGPSTAELVYSPVASWTPFKDTAIGSGTFTFAFQGNQFWTGANTDAQQSGMGLLVPPTITNTRKSPTPTPCPATGYPYRSGNIPSPTMTATNMPATRRPISSTMRSRKTAPRPMPTRVWAPTRRSRPSRTS
jgi:hypothetical protein